METSNTFILSWDMSGLESVIPVSDIERSAMWEALKADHTLEHSMKGRTETVGSILSRLMLRARYNSQRHYEIYAVDFDHTMTSDDIKDWFNHAPQAAADLVRERGRKLYSDRLRDKEVRIT